MLSQISRKCSFNGIEQTVLRSFYAFSPHGVLTSRNFDYGMANLTSLGKKRGETRTVVKRKKRKLQMLLL